MHLTAVTREADPCLRTSLQITCENQVARTARLTCLWDCGQVSSALRPPDTVLPSHWRREVTTIHTSSSLRFILLYLILVRGAMRDRIPRGKCREKKLEHRAKECIAADADTSWVDAKMSWVLWPPVGTSRPRFVALLYPGSRGFQWPFVFPEISYTSDAVVALWP